MTAITELRKTAWYILVDEDGRQYADAERHIWFSEEVIRPIARDMRVMPMRVRGGGLKTVVVGYTADGE